MDTVTYPHPEVIMRLGQRFVPMRLQVDKAAELASQFNIVWTPGLVVLDGSKRVWVRTFGYCPPEEFLPWLALSEGKFHFGRAHFDKAEACFAECHATWPKSHAAPEALYWQGVARYKQGDVQGLGQFWYRLRREHPESLWTQKASFLWLRKREEARKE